VSSTVVVEILLALLAVTTGVVTFLAASRTQRQESKTAAVAVDAAAYERARDSYESALQTLRDELTACRSDLVSARGDIVSLRDEITRLRNELRNGR
jgi:predicted  nucleic acid-binding Zn-ribbon protein